MQKKISGIFKSTTISRTFECTTNSRTAEVQAQYDIIIESLQALIFVQAGSICNFCPGNA